MEFLQQGGDYGIIGLLLALSFWAMAVVVAIPCAIVLTLAADDAVYLNDQTVPDQQLAEKLHGYAKDTSVIVRADRMIAGTLRGHGR